MEAKRRFAHIEPYKGVRRARPLCRLRWVRRFYNEIHYSSLAPLLSTLPPRGCFTVLVFGGIPMYAFDVSTVAIAFPAACAQIHCRRWAQLSTPCAHTLVSIMCAKHPLSTLCADMHYQHSVSNTTFSQICCQAAFTSMML